MQALCKTFLLAAPAPAPAPAPALHAGQPTLPVSHSEQQQPPLLLLYSHRHDLSLAEASLQPTPIPIPIPTQAPNLPDFTLVSLGLVVLFWIGNYVVPDFIFNKLFGSDAGNKNDSEKQKVLDGLVGGIDKTVASGRSGAVANSEEEGTVSATGFGKRVSKVRKGNK